MRYNVQINTGNKEYDEYLESDEMARKRQTYTVMNEENELEEEE